MANLNQFGAAVPNSSGKLGDQAALKCILSPCHNHVAAAIPH
jgi:hypothetical protein